MKIEGPAVRLTIHIGEADHVGGRPLSSEIVRRARAHGLAGATVVRGIEGFGASSRIHAAHILSLSEDLPMVVTLVDRADRIDSFVDVLDELITEGLVIRENVEVLAYRPGPPPEAGPGTAS